MPFCLTFSCALARSAHGNRGIWVTPACRRWAALGDVAITSMNSDWVLNHYHHNSSWLGSLPQPLLAIIPYDNLGFHPDPYLNNHSPWSLGGSPTYATVVARGIHHLHLLTCGHVAARDRLGREAVTSPTVLIQVHHGPWYMVYALVVSSRGYRLYSGFSRWIIKDDNQQ